MFKNNDIVCFLGDSITAAGLWEAEVYQILRKKYRIRCYNCGVAGSTADKALGYFYSECLIYNPDYVVLMFGMNDLDRLLYSEGSINMADLDKHREEKNKKHIEKYEEIIKSCKEFGAEVIICLPTPYDEITEGDEIILHFQQALNKAADMQIELSEKYNCKVVNFKDNMLPMLGKHKIVCEDRVHPTEYGYHVMAQIFLKELAEIEECDFATPFVFEDWNMKRFDAEQKNGKLNYVELCDLYFEGYAKDKKVEEIKEMAKKKLEMWEDKSTYIPQAYEEYIEKGHMRLKNKGEVVKLTVF